MHQKERQVLSQILENDIKIKKGKRTSIVTVRDQYHLPDLPWFSLQTISFSYEYLCDFVKKFNTHGVNAIIPYAQKELFHEYLVTMSL
jgi:hypothetical protein